MLKIGSRKNILIFFFRLTGLLGCFFFVLYIVDINLLVTSLKQLTSRIVIAALMCAFFRLWLVSIRWQLLNTDVERQLSRWQYYRYMIISNIFNLFMPGALGGDIARLTLVFRAVETNRSANILAVLVDRIIGFSSIIMLGTIACFFAPELRSRGQYFLFLFILIVVFLIALIMAISSALNNFFIRMLKHQGRWGRKIINLINAWRRVTEFYHENPRRILLALLLCIPIHISWLMIVYILAHNIGIDISFLSLSIVTCLVWIISAVPLTFSGLGVRELSFVYLLSLQGISAEPATALSLYQFAITVLVAMIGIPFIWIGYMRPSKAGIQQS